MSLTGTLLGLLMIPLKAKSSLTSKPEPRPKEIDNLAVMALAEEVKLLQFALNHWRRSGTALMEENERLHAELHTVRTERNLARLQSQQAAVNQLNQSLHLQQMADNQGLAQSILQARSYQGIGQQAYQALGQLQQGLALMSQAYGDCTCTPTRAEALRQR